MKIFLQKLEIPKSAMRASVDKKLLDQKYRACRLDSLEEIIGYTFKEKSFLLEACTHASYQTSQVKKSSSSLMKQMLIDWELVSEAS